MNNKMIIKFKLNKNPIENPPNLQYKTIRKMSQYNNLPYDGDWINSRDNQQSTTEINRWKRFGIYNFCYYHTWRKKHRMVVGDQKIKDLKRTMTWFPPCPWHGYNPTGFFKFFLPPGASRHVRFPYPAFLTFLVLIFQLIILQMELKIIVFNLDL